MIIVFFFFSFFPCPYPYLQHNAVHGGSGTASLIRPWEESQIATGHHNPTGVLFQLFRCPVEVEAADLGGKAAGGAPPDFITPTEACKYFKGQRL